MVKQFTLLLCFALSVSGLAQQEPKPIEIKPPSAPEAVYQQVSETSAYREEITTFPSALTTGVPDNDQVPLHLFLPKGATGPTDAVLILHYWGASDLRIERALANELAKRGIASAILELPYHLKRAPAGTKSGELAIRPDPDLLRLTMIQAVYDARRALEILGRRPEISGKSLGIAGISLGAVIATSVYAIEPNVKSAAILLGGVDLAKIIWRSSRVVNQRAELRRLGFTEESLAAVLKDVEPSTYITQRKEGNLFIVGARYDTVVPTESTQNLMDLEPSAKKLWIDTGHYGGIFVQPQLFREVGKYFQSTLEGKPYEPPREILAPTIRLGAIFDSSGQFDVGAGLDIFRPRTVTDVFGTLLVTPRGPKFYFGKGVDRGVSVGVAIGSQRTVLGLLWSIVI
ncbi:MAG: alpha/beta hydrolase family protein [Armatimonadetes bacterium]|nr:alpha/beta hydrolase family protein [Armatimonadota bacterium]